MARNWKQDESPDQVIMLQQVRYRIRSMTEGNLQWTHSFEHRAGIQYIIDSILRIHSDENTLDSRVEFSFTGQWNVGICTIASTPVFNSMFLTPFRWTFSAGLGYKWDKFGSLNLGLTGGRLTYVRNSHVYEKLNIDRFFGVEKGEKILLEYGLSLRVIIDHDLGKKVHWNADLILFKNKNRPVDISLKSSVSFQIGRFIRTSLQTRLLYEKEISPKIQLENLVTAGFSIVL